MDTSDKIKIFLVDDDIMFVESLRHLLSNDKADIRSFTSGEDCIKYLDESPQIVVLDYSLNNTLNGVQVLNKIKHISPETEVIMLSGAGNHIVKNDTLKYGAYDFIEKGEGAALIVTTEVKQLCDEIETSRIADNENKKLITINAVIIILFIIVFVLTRIK